MCANSIERKKPSSKRANKARTEPPVNSQEAGGQEPRPRLKAYWGVYNEKFQQVALFEYHEQRKAKQAAKKLTGSKKGGHFVRLVKQEMDE